MKTGVKTSYKNKNIAGQVLTYNSQNFHWLNRKTRPRMNCEWIEQPFFKKSEQKNKNQTENQRQNAACEQKKTTSEKRKFKSNKKLGLEWAVNGLGKPFRKKIRSKKSKKLKIRVKLPHVKKPLPRNRIFVQTQFSHSTLKLERKKFTPQNHSLFRSISCFGVTKITTPIWLQKSWKCVNRS